MTEFRGIYDDYMNNKCEFVWDKIWSLNYETLVSDDKKEVDLVIRELLTRIATNCNSVFVALEKLGFSFENFGNLNETNQPYIKRSEIEYLKTFSELATRNEGTLKLPVIFTAFCSFFKVVDFRGTIQEFNVDILLDSLFIESFDNYAEALVFMSDQAYKQKIIRSCMFSSDLYIKENVSGGGFGPSIIVEKETYIDNLVINFANEFEMTFVKYLRFCFHWGCFANLFWATDAEKEPFEAYLEEVRSKLILF